jgi:hypothetical protein
MSILFGQAIAFSAAFFLVVGQAEARQKQGGEIQVASSHLTQEQVVDRVFTAVERRILRRYYEARGVSNTSDDLDRGGKHGNKSAGKGNNKGMPPGLAKRGDNLPPGLAKRGGELPPGLAKRLPSDLERELPPRPRTYRRVVVDNDIVLIDAATNKVLDVLEDVLLGR